nr:nucleoside-diphosphate sugar epimerase/dehydratase [Deinococcus aestuarii]
MIFAVAPVVAYLVRFDFGRGGYVYDAGIYALLTLPLKAAVLGLFRQHRLIWRYVGFEDLWSLVRPVGVYVVGALLLTVWLRSWLVVPWSVPPVEGLLAFLLMCGARLVARGRLDRRQPPQAGQTPRRALIVGAGIVGRVVAGELLRHPREQLTLVGFLDDDPSKRGKSLLGVSVLGSYPHLAQVVRERGVNLLVIAMPSAGGRVIRRYFDRAQEIGLEARIVPGMNELVGGQVTVNQLREVRIEDLLRRPPIRLDDDLIRSYLEDKAVLVTGAGGSIGSEIVRQVVRFRPRHVLLLGRGENSIFVIEQELRRTWPAIKTTALIADVRHLERLEGVFRQHRPDVVFHAAAHKHVPLMEAAPCEAVGNNVFGTCNVAELCLRYDVACLVNVSTDKAVNPSSVMGATKRVAEMVVADASRRAGPHQTFVSVRFGNVLGSRGSVVLTFLQQVRSGGPVTVTHPDMTRYFMTIPEAARLVLQSGGMAHNGQVCLLNMGQPVRVVDLAQDIIRLSGAQDVDIVFSGVRPGEKLHEELFASAEQTEVTTHGDVFTVRSEQPEPQILGRLLQDLGDAARGSLDDEVYRLLRATIAQNELKPKEPYAQSLSGAL